MKTFDASKCFAIMFTAAKYASCCPTSS